MKQNMGKSDRLIRIFLGLIVIAGGINYESWWGGIGLIPLITAFIGWCPLYFPFRFSTKKISLNEGGIR